MGLIKWQFFQNTGGRVAIDAYDIIIIEEKQSTCLISYVDDRDVTVVESFDEILKQINDG